MKVVYKCTFERVNDIIDRARADDVEIDYIELTTLEWHMFGQKAGIYTIGLNKTPHEAPITDCDYRGVQLRKKR